MNRYISVAYLLMLFVFMGVLFVGFSTQRNPESELIGTWKEVSWEYEKLDSDEEDNFLRKQISAQEQVEISKELVIHESEIWEFKPGGYLNLVKMDLDSENLNWRLKGRGNILKLFGNENSPEHYQIYKLTKNEMEIHFNSDIQARGIVKMKFERI